MGHLCVQQYRDGAHVELGWNAKENTLSRVTVLWETSNARESLFFLIEKNVYGRLHCTNGNHLTFTGENYCDDVVFLWYDDNTNRCTNQYVSTIPDDRHCDGKNYIRLLIFDNVFRYVPRHIFIILKHAKPTTIQPTKCNNNNNKMYQRTKCGYYENVQQPSSLYNNYTNIV